jgi:hypothetical protein
MLRVLLRRGEGSGRVAYDCLRTTVGKMLDASLVPACGTDGLVSLRGTATSWTDFGASAVGTALGVGTRGGAGASIGTIGGCG